MARRPTFHRPPARDARSVRDLADADAVAERVTDAEVGAVGLLADLVGDVDAGGHQLLVEAVRVVGAEHDRATGGALGEEVADLGRGGLVHRRRSGTLQQDLAALVAGHVDRQPAHEAEVGVGVDLEAEDADVEVERLVLVEHEEVGNTGVSEHAQDATQASPRRLFRNCSVASTPSRSRSARSPAPASERRGRRPGSRRPPRGSGA